MRWILLALLLGGCEVEVPDAQKECKEFDYTAMKDGSPITCHMLWCAKNVGTQYAMSGMAPLWCTTAAPTPKETVPNADHQPAR